ncbi:MAG: biotin--[Lachnospiraceae bacterium]|nr:biotin--[acetyl-CoA-carboxylase] ligase [Lachnospiraceae bacterium]
MTTRDRVLSALEHNKGEFISGEELADAIGVSRNSVWKAVRDLHEKGYTIDSVTNRGYCLTTESDIISVQGISAFLDEKSYIDYIEVYDELSSTNDVAKQKAISAPSYKHAIIAKTQTKGRGHGSTNYESPKGGIYISVILNPKELVYKNITVCAAVFVADVLEEITGENTRIKWVNNIYIDDRKVCGILSETIADMETGAPDTYIVGIGIKYDILSKNELIAKLLNRIYNPKKYYTKTEITDNYEKRLMYVNDSVKFRIYDANEEKHFNAVIVGINEDGHLIVKEDNELRILQTGEIVEI